MSKKQSPPDKRDWRFLAASVAAFVALVAAYSNHFRNEFHFDDAHVIENNLAIRSLANVGSFFADASTFSSLAQNSTYRPLLSVTFAIDYWLGRGLSPAQFHITQFALLTICGIALFLFFHHLMQRAVVDSRNRYLALGAATIFSIHTANSETVNYISSRSDLLSTIFVLASFLVYIHFPKLRRWHLFVVPMAIGAFVKTPAVIFAPLFVAYLLLVERDVRPLDAFTARYRRDLLWVARRALPSFAAACACFLFVESMNPSGQTYGGGGRIEYFRTQIYAWAHYERLFFLPVGLTADTDLTLFEKADDARRRAEGHRSAAGQKEPVDAIERAHRLQHHAERFARRRAVVIRAGAHRLVEKQDRTACGPA